MLNLAVEVNHITIPAKDKRGSARLLAYVLGLEVGPELGHLVRARTGNGLTLDFADSEDFWPLQCAFLVSATEFDGALTRLRSKAIRFYAEFDGTRLGEINRLHGGRGVYFDDPNGHLFELIEQPDTTTADSGIKALAIKWTIVANGATSAASGAAARR